MIVLYGAPPSGKGNPNPILPWPNEDTILPYTSPESKRTKPTDYGEEETTAAAQIEKLKKFREVLLERIAAGEAAKDRKSTRLNSSHVSESRMPSSA